MERGFKQLTECLSQTFPTTFYPRSATERKTISVGVGVRPIEGEKKQVKIDRRVSERREFHRREVSKGAALSSSAF